MGVTLKFDFPYSDGHDFFGRSQNIAVLVDKNDAGLLEGTVIDFRDGQFRIEHSSHR